MCPAGPALAFACRGGKLARQSGRSPQASRETVTFMSESRHGGTLKRAALWFATWMTFGATAFALAHSVAGAWTIDDAEITYGYARSVVRGDWFSLSPEGPRVEGLSNPLMLILSIAAEALGLLDPFLTHAVLEPFEFGLLLFLVWCLLGVALPARDPRRALLTAAFAALELVTPATAIWYGSGLENLQVTIAIAFLLLRMNETLAGRPRLGLDALSIVLVALVRPEALLYAAATSAGALLYAFFPRAHGSRRVVVRALAAAWVVSAAVLLVGLTVRWSIFASLLPNTYYAKTGKGAPGVFSAGYLRALLAYGGTAALAVVAALLPAKAEARRLKTLLLFVIPTTFVLPAIGGKDWMGEHRFGTPYVAAVHMLFVVALAAARWPFPIAHLQPGWLRRTRLAATAVVAFVPAIPLAYKSDTIARFYRQQRTTIDAVLDLQGLVRVDIQRHLGLFEPVVALGDAGGSRLIGKMDLLDTLGLTDLHIPHIRTDSKLLHRYQLGERAMDLVVWHGAGAMASQAFGDKIWHLADFPGTPRAFWARRSLVTFEDLPAGAAALGRRGSVQVWLSPTTIWQAAPGAYARIEIILRIPLDAQPADHPGSVMLSMRLGDAGDADEERLPLLGVTTRHHTPKPMRAGVLHRQAFLLRAPERAGRYPVNLRGLPGPPLEVGAVRAIPIAELRPDDLERIVGGPSDPLLERAQRLAQLSEQLQPRRRRAETVEDLYRFREACYDRSWALVTRLRRLWPDFAAAPPARPEIRTFVDAFKDSAASEVVRALRIAADPRTADRHAADAVVAAGRLVDGLRRRRLTGILDRGTTAAEPRALVCAVRERLRSTPEADHRYKILVGLVLLDPRDSSAQQVLLHTRPYGTDLPYR